VPEGLLLVVWSSIGLWVVGWVGLWVQSFYLAMGWSVVWWVGWVEEIELTDNSESEMSEDVFFNPISFPFPFPYC